MKLRPQVLTTLALTAILAASPLSADEKAGAIIEKAFEAARANDALTREYIYHERVEDRRFSRKGVEKSRSSQTWDVTLYEGGDYRRLIARDDRPLDAAAEARERRKLDRHIRKTINATPRQREQWRARVEKERREGEEFLQEITRAFDFEILREEEVGGFPTWVISAEPRAGYQPRGRMARALTKVRATLWVSQEDHGWVQAEIETFEDFTWAAVYKLKSGARIRFRQRRLDDRVWVTERWNVRLLARIALVVRIDAELVGTYDNFRRFSAETTTTGWSEVD